MKKIILISFLILASILTFGQDKAKVTILLDLRQTCKMDNTTLEFFDCSEPVQNGSVILVDDWSNARRGEDIFTHVTSDMSSKYFVISQNTEGSVSIADVKSDTGNKYLFIFDFAGKAVTAIFLNDEYKNDDYSIVVNWRIMNTHLENR